MKRQALIISIPKLKILLEDLEKSDKQMCEELGVPYEPSEKVLISIINKEGLSDTWEIEGW